MQGNFQYKDVNLTVNAGFSGIKSIVVQCRNYNQTLTAEQFMELIYSAIDAAAKPLDPAPPATGT